MNTILCQRMRAEYELFLDGDLDRGAEIVFVDHLVDCSACAAFVGEDVRLAETVARAYATVPVPAARRHAGSLPCVAVVMRLRPGWAPVSVCIAGMIVAEAATTALGAARIGAFDFWLATGAVGTIGMVHAFVFGFVYKSVSAQILAVVTDQPSCRAETTLILDKAVGPAVEERMQLLVDLGLVVRLPDGAYTPTADGQAAAARLKKVQGLFGIERSGLYQQGA